MLALIVMFLIGLATGFIFAEIRSRSKPIAGVLRIDNSDPEDGPYLFLELSISPEKFEESSKLIFKVNHSNYISQK